jgi:putative holliday junction resolvase
MSGDLSPQAAKAQAFAQMLRQETGLPVHLWDERLTTTEAHRHLHASGLAGAKHRKVVDQVAAVLILQGYLDALAMREERKTDMADDSLRVPSQT